MMRIFLVGYMGCGKTTIGRPLSKALGYRFVDMDHHLIDTYGMSITEIFESYGEERFREMERDCIGRLCGEENLVVSTGGGSACFYDNMDRMNEAGTTIYLKVSPEGLVKRLAHGRDKRPLLRGKDDEELLRFITEALDAREEYYGKARVIVDCDGYSDLQVIEKCVRVVQGLAR